MCSYSLGCTVLVLPSSDLAASFCIGRNLSNHRDLSFMGSSGLGKP